MADCYQAWSEPRPYREALDAGAVATRLRDEVKAGRLDGAAVNAVLRAAGHRATPPGVAGRTNGAGGRGVAISRPWHVAAKRLRCVWSSHGRRRATMSSTSTPRSASPTGPWQACSRPDTVSSERIANIGRSPHASRCTSVASSYDNHRADRPSTDRRGHGGRRGVRRQAPRDHHRPPPHQPHRARLAYAAVRARHCGPGDIGRARRARWFQERYVREWLAAMATAGIFEYDVEKRRFWLPVEHAAVPTGDKADNLAPVAFLVSVITRRGEAAVAASRRAVACRGMPTCRRCMTL